MFWSMLIAAIIIAAVGWVALPAALAILGIRFVRKRLLGPGATEHRGPAQLGMGSSDQQLATVSRKGCPLREKESLRSLEKRLKVAHDSCLVALNTRITSELARARIAPPLEEAYTQIWNEIMSIYAFCERNDLVGTLRKANTSTTASDIYLQAYQRDLAKVHTAMGKTEECLAAYERTVATLEVASVEADISSDFDDAIEMLQDLRNELPQYNLEDRI